MFFWGGKLLGVSERYLFLFLQRLYRPFRTAPTRFWRSKLLEVSDGYVWAAANNKESAVLWNYNCPLRVFGGVNYMKLVKDTLGQRQ